MLRSSNSDNYQVRTVLSGNEFGEDTFTFKRFSGTVLFHILERDEMCGLQIKAKYRNYRNVSLAS